MSAFYVLIFLLGLILGSFLNVCIYRIPRKESISFPPSHCPKCETDLRAFDLFPVASFLYLGGKCRYCGNKISWRYPFVELLTGSLFLLTALLIGLELVLIKYLFMVSLFVVISFIDLEHYLIPDKIIIFGFIVGIGLNIVIKDVTLVNSLLGFAAGGGFLLLLAVVSNGGMGGGDIKLAALIGFLLGWQKVLLGLFFGALVAAVIGIVLIVLELKKRKEPIPFGPFIALGTLFVMFLGEKLVSWYLSLYGL